MSDYTPELEELREVWGDRAVSREGRSTTRWRELSVVAIAEFDRAIAKVRADAKVEALREAANEWAEGEWAAALLVADDDVSAAIAVTTWLNRRADNLEAS